MQQKVVAACREPELYEILLAPAGPNRNVPQYVSDPGAGAPD
jgi:hypothetical protein